MRLVLDTNVVLSGVLWRGTPYRLLEMISQQSSVQIYSSVVLLEELAEVFARPFAAERLALLIGKTAREVLTDYVEAVELADPIEVPRVVSSDPDDDHVIAVALAAHVDCIVSGDSDLLSIGRFKRIDILTAAQTMQRIAG